MVLMAIVQFLPAGTLAWPAGWIFFLMTFSFSIGLSLWLWRFNPELLKERLTGVGRADQKTWDKVFLALAAPVFLGWMVIMGLDAVRFKWSHVMLWLQWVGALLLLGSFYIFYRAFRENTYLSPAVRIQSERGQTVVSTGPYKYVRHPLYAGFVLFALGTPLLLGSWSGVLGGLILISMMAWRAVHEEQMLFQELPGYEAYMQRVRYRLIPYVW